MCRNSAIHHHVKSPFLLHDYLVLALLQQGLTWAAQQWTLPLADSLPTSAVALPSTPLDSCRAVGIAPLGLRPIAAPSSALPDSDRPLFFVNSASLCLIAFIVEGKLSVRSWNSRIRCSTSEVSCTTWANPFKDMLTCRTRRRMLN